MCAGRLQQALGAAAGYVHHGGIGDDTIENRLNGRDLGELTVVRGLFHALEFLRREPASGSGGRTGGGVRIRAWRRGLHQAGQFLHGGVRRVIVDGFAGALRVFVGERLFAGEGEAFVVGVDVVLKISGPAPGRRFSGACSRLS